MNALDCLEGATQEVRSLTASCVRAMQPILEYRDGTLCLEAVARASAIIATSCAADGAESQVVAQMAAIIRSIATDANRVPHLGIVQ